MGLTATQVEKVVMRTGTQIRALLEMDLEIIPIAMEKIIHLELQLKIMAQIPKFGMRLTITCLTILK